MQNKTMSNLSKRKKATCVGKLDKNNNYDYNEHEDMEPLPSIPTGEDILQDSGSIAFLETKFKNLSPKWKNGFVRGFYGTLMILGFSFIVSLGPLAITLLILCIQFKCFHEIITIGYTVYKSHNLPWFRSISWYFLITSNYYLYGESLIEKFGLLLNPDGYLMIFITYHRFISFSFYLAGFIAFVLSLKKTYYLKQFTLFGYTHLTLLVIVIQSNLMIQNVFKGLIWFLLPVSLINCNDIMAYVFGFFFGKTKLIQLSPKKTWEGFIGGGFSTILFGFVLSSFLCDYESMTCPLDYDELYERVTFNCLPQNIFNYQTYRGFLGIEMIAHPFQFHGLAMSIFASTIGPFGGFFASGFKRAFKIKDFGDTIPGHGGLMDRFDCQLIMASFVNVYFHSFILSSSPKKLFNHLLMLKHEDQLEFLRLTKEHFVGVRFRN